MAKQPGRKGIHSRRVFKYWNDKIERLGPRKDGSFENELHACFACGSVRMLEVCHIIPRCYGGSDDLENLHVLCKRCHGESEALKAYWPWIHWKRVNEWKPYGDHINDYVTKCGIILDYGRISDLEEANVYFKEVLTEVFWEMTYIPNYPYKEIIL
jgi:hypothetical protein